MMGAFLDLLGIPHESGLISMRTSRSPRPDVETSRRRAGGKAPDRRRSLYLGTLVSRIPRPGESSRTCPPRLQIDLLTWRTILMPCVLIVEDDHDVREMLAMLLRQESYEVMTATNGAESAQSDAAPPAEPGPAGPR